MNSIPSLPPSKTYEYPFDVWILPETFIKLNEYATAAQPNEIGGLARLEINGTDVFVVDVEMFPQTASRGTFDISPEEIGKFTRKLIKDGRTDELSEWCSIVHSHPIGMSPQMSAVDVDAIKRFASEGDAFSLIITATSDASSKRLLMHYCTNVRGNKFIINDIPVGIAIPEWQSKDAETLAKFVIDMYDNQNLNESECSLLKRYCEEFIQSKIPAMFHSDRSDLRTQIELEVMEFVKSEPARIISTPASNGGIRTFVNVSKNTSSEDLMLIANRIDPTGNDREVSRSTMKHAAKLLRQRAMNHADPEVAQFMRDAADQKLDISSSGIDDKEFFPDDDEIDVGDMVLLKPSSINSIINQATDPQSWFEIEEMIDTAYPVDSIESGVYMVNGYALYFKDLISVEHSPAWPEGIWQ